VLTATGFVNGIFDPPQNKHPLTDQQKNWYSLLRRRPLWLRQIWWRGLLGKWVKYNEIFIYLFIPFIMNSPTGQTRRQIFTLDGSNDANSRKDMHFGGLVDIAPNFRGEIPRRPHFLCVNRRFQAKRAKYRKFHVMETTASISTKFCTTIETIKKSSWVVPIGAQQIQDGGRPPF